MWSLVMPKYEYWIHYILKLTLMTYMWPTNPDL